MWRGIDVFRVGALIYAVLLYAGTAEHAERPALGWVVIVGMTAWTVFLLLVRSRTAPLLIADLVVTMLAIGATAAVQTGTQIAHGDPTIPSFWAAAPAIMWATAWGWRGGAVAAAMIGLADLAVIKLPPDGLDRGISGDTVHNIVLLVLAGLIFGYSVGLVRLGQARLDQATAMQAAARERERLARDIHDSVLQVLAYVKRRGSEIGGEAAVIAQLAGDQEARLRSLIATGPEPVATAGGGRGESTGDVHRVDLRRELAALAATGITVSGPADPVVMSRPAAEAVTAAVREAVTNVHRHVGETAEAWILVEDEGDAVVVSVRDDGPGIPEGRLESAAAEGRLGVRSSIQGRIADVGGKVAIVSAPGQGTEVEIRVPRVMRP
jgi:signal transduction histidine kinase